VGTGRANNHQKPFYSHWITGFGACAGVSSRFSVPIRERAACRAACLGAKADTQDKKLIKSFFIVFSPQLY